MTDANNTTKYVKNRDLSAFIASKEGDIVGVSLCGLDIKIHGVSGYVNANDLFYGAEASYDEWRYCYPTKRLIDELKTQHSVSTKDLIFKYKEDDSNDHYVHWDLACDIVCFLYPDHKVEVSGDLLELYVNKAKGVVSMRDIADSIAQSEKKSVDKFDELISLVKSFPVEAKPEKTAFDEILEKLAKDIDAVMNNSGSSVSNKRANVAKLLEKLSKAIDVKIFLENENEDEDEDEDEDDVFEVFMDEDEDDVPEVSEEEPVKPVAIKEPVKPVAIKKPVKKVVPKEECTIALFVDNYWHGEEEEDDDEVSVIFCNRSNKDEKIKEHKKKYPFCEVRCYADKGVPKIDTKWNGFVAKYGEGLLITNSKCVTDFSLARGKYISDVCTLFQKYAYPC